MSADAKLKSYIDRILRCREAEDLAKEDTKAVYAELAGEGYEKSVVGQVVTFLRKREKDGDKLTEQSAKFDLYLEAYERPSHAHTRVRGEDDVSPRLIKQVVDGMQTEAGRAALLTAVDIMIEREEAEENPPETATTQRVNGHSQHEGANAQATVRNEAVTVVGTESGTVANSTVEIPSSASHAANAGGDDVDRSGSPATHLVTGEGTAHSALPANSDFVMEDVPPMPMKRPAFAHCFPELSNAAYERLGTDIAFKGIQDPIIRWGDLIVDGWARYTIARELGINYPVQEYTGTDVLLDVIEWQRASRNFTPAQEKKIAADLAKEFPQRADEIMATFGLVEALEPAE